MDYTHKTVQTVHTVTNLKTSIYCNYNSSHRFVDCILSSTVTITYVNILYTDFIEFVTLMIFVTIAKQTEKIS